VITLLWLSFLLGLRHALDADHVTTVVALSSRPLEVGQAVRIAGAWGIGHAVVMLAVGLAVVGFNIHFPPAIDRYVEGAAGLLLLVLGLDSLRRLRHRPGAAGHRGRHAGPHSADLLSKALFIGGVHGLEGSATLAMMALPALRSFGAVLTYLALFGLGSIVGMICCSLALAWPLRRSMRTSFGARTISVVVGSVSVVLGSWIAVRASF